MRPCRGPTISFQPYMPEEIFEALERARIWKARSNLESTEKRARRHDEDETLRSLRAGWETRCLARSGLDMETIEELNRAVSAILGQARLNGELAAG